MTLFAGLAAVISQLVLSLVNQSPLATTIAVKHANIRCIRQKSKNSRLSIVPSAIQPLILGNLGREMMKTDEYL
jgi:hypothetical protein